MNWLKITCASATFITSWYYNYHGTQNRRDGETGRAIANLTCSRIYFAAFLVILSSF